MNFHFENCRAMKENMAFAFIQRLQSISEQWSAC